MKYIKGYKSYNKDLNRINEEIFGSIGKLFGGFFKKVAQNIRKTKGGNEIEEIYKKYLNLINDTLKKKADLDLNIMSADQAVTIKESLIREQDEDLEAKADSTNAKMSVSTLKAKKSILDQVLSKYKEMAMAEMTDVLKKYGGAGKNPDLEVIIRCKKDQFDLDFLNAQINYLEVSGDKTMVAEIKSKRDKIAKGIETVYKEFGKKGIVEYKVGDTVTYLLKGKVKSEIDPSKDLEDQRDIVGVNKISKIEGDVYKLTDREGKETITKSLEEILGKAKKKEYKRGDKIKYSKKDGTVAEAEVMDNKDVEEGLLKVRTETNPNGFVIAKSKIQL